MPVTEVGILRVSHVSACIHPRLLKIGQPAAFADRLADPTPVRGLQVGLPFASDLPTENEFWARILTGQKLRIPHRPDPGDQANKFLAAGVPLRHRGGLEVEGAGQARLEAHLHPFGVVAMTTVDLCWPERVSLQEAGAQVKELEKRSAVPSLRGGNGEGTGSRGTELPATVLGKAAAETAEHLVWLLTTPGPDDTLTMPGDITNMPDDIAGTDPYRLSTVIDAKIKGEFTGMPSPKSQVHVALHCLSGGDEDCLAEPQNAFVAQWARRGYAWPPASLVYSLECGTCRLSGRAAAPPGPQETSTADLHRLLLLQVAYITASAGLIRAAVANPSHELFPAWAKNAARIMAALYGPGRDYAQWGQIPHALLDSLGTPGDVAKLPDGTALQPNPDPLYGIPDYPVA